MIKFFVPEIRIGRIQPLGPNDVPSGNDKQPVSDPIGADVDGIDGDEQGDRRHHGGPDKAIHAYAAVNCPLRVADLPEWVSSFCVGAFGGNLVVESATEADTCLGDLWRLDDVLLEVSQGHQPCWRLNHRFRGPDMAQLVQQTGRTSWYFCRIKPVELRAREDAVLRGRPHPDWTIARVSHPLYNDRLNKHDLVESASLPSLPDSWRRLAEARLHSGQPEDWACRIETPG